MKLIGQLFFMSTILWSCNSSINQIEKLQKENEELRAKLTILQNQLPENVYRAIVVANKNELKLGDEYMADIRLSVINTKNPPTVILCNIMNDEYIPTGDTLQYSNEFQCSLYHLKTKDIGEYKWSGIILQTIDGNLKRFPFTMKYTVKK